MTWLRRLPVAFRRRSPLALCGILFCGIFVWRLIPPLLLRPHFVNDHCEVDFIAKSLAVTGQFANPYAVPTGPTTHAAPGFVFLLAAIYRVFGFGPLGEAVRQTLCCAASSLLWALLPLFSSAAGLGLRSGVIAALVGGVLPLRYHIETACAFGEPFPAALMVLLAVCTMFVWMDGRFTAARAALQGALGGVLLLFSPGYLVILAGFTFAETFLRPRSGWHSPAIRAAVAMLVVMPWIVRNYREFHHLIFVRGNLGLELAVSNHDTALPVHWLNQFAAGTIAIHPMAAPAPSRELSRVGERAYYDEMNRRAMVWIRTHPRQFSLLTLRRFLAFWFPPPEGAGWQAAARSGFAWLESIAGLAGVVLMLRKGYPAGRMFAGFLLLFPLVYYLVSFDVRYRYPVEWILVFSACWLLTYMQAQRYPESPECAPVGPRRNA